MDNYNLWQFSTQRIIIMKMYYAENVFNSYINISFSVNMNMHYSPITLISPLFTNLLVILPIWTMSVMIE